VSRCRERLFQVVALGGLVALWTTGIATADEWLVYIGGGIQDIEGAWEERGRIVVFTLRGGTLASVPFEDVDLPTSAFITWQLGGRRKPPPRPELSEPAPGAGAEPQVVEDCIAARLKAIRSGETLEVVVGGEPETIHLACLDAPETEHQFPELAWFGRATVSAIELGLKPGAEICLVEQTPERRDRQGHRIVDVKWADGRDFAEAVIFDGLGILRPGKCPRALYLRRLEDRAIAEQRGLWGPMSQKAAFQAVMSGPAVDAGPSRGQVPSRAPGRT
jgi:endonuclease YncB( thermonuclease family)